MQAKHGAWNPVRACQLHACLAELKRSQEHSGFTRACHLTMIILLLTTTRRGKVLWAAAAAAAAVGF